MSNFIYNDGYGRHIHELSIPGRPYDHDKKIDCQACITKIDHLRIKLMEKYGWEVWPDDLRGCLITD